MNYTAVIRTLGKAGDKYRKLLDSLMSQTLKPEAIIVYIAEGYPIPAEKSGVEKYVYVKKGMVAQRALRYDEVNTEYILFLDDDVFLPDDAVENMFRLLEKYHADIISPDVFSNSSRSLTGKISMAISGRMLPRFHDSEYGYKVMKNGGYSYNNNPKPGVYISQTNAGPCFMCRKNTFLHINFKEELWLDDLKYALGDDQVMFYKMYLSGFNQLTWYDSGIIHMDAGTATISDERQKINIYSDIRFKIIFWHRFIYKPEKNILNKLWSILCIGYTLTFTLIISLAKFNTDILKLKYDAIKNGISFIRSDKYKSIPQIRKQNHI